MWMLIVNLVASLARRSIQPMPETKHMKVEITPSYGHAAYK